jgi:hypothetical protein
MILLQILYLLWYPYLHEIETINSQNLLIANHIDQSKVSVRLCGGFLSTLVYRDKMISHDHFPELVEQICIDLYLKNDVQCAGGRCP